MFDPYRLILTVHHYEVKCKVASGFQGSLQVITFTEVGWAVQSLVALRDMLHP